MSEVYAAHSWRCLELGSICELGDDSICKPQRAPSRDITCLRRVILCRLEREREGGREEREREREREDTCQKSGST